VQRVQVPPGALRVTLTGAWTREGVTSRPPWGAEGVFANQENPHVLSELKRETHILSLLTSRANFLSRGAQKKRKLKLAGEHDLNGGSKGEILKILPGRT